MFPNYDSVPGAIKRNCVELSFETTAFKESNIRGIIKNRENFPNEKNCDLILVKEYLYREDECEGFEDLADLGDIPTDLDIVCSNCYDAGWAGGRYFMRIHCLSATNLSESEEYYLKCDLVPDALSCGGGYFADGRYWLLP